jgi:hypothetical protein
LIDKWSETFAASGHIVLNEFGDRAHTDYDYWLLNNNHGWENIGYYQGDSGRKYWLRRVF